MANCSSCNGSCQTGTRVGALNSLCRTGYRFPYYTGPCPPAPCVDNCGCSNPCSSCNRCGCNALATVTGDGCLRTGCGSCNGCGNCGGCGCGNCSNFSNRSGWGSCNCCGNCSNCSNCNGCNNCNNCNGCNSCSTCDLCNQCPWNCNSCDNAGCGSDCCDGSIWNGCAAHGVFTAGGPLNLSAGSSVNFENHSGETCCFSNSYGSILIRQPGLYFAAVTVDIPKNADVDTVMRLELDGRTITPAEIAISTDCGGCASNFCGHAIIQACSGSLLKLVTLRELFIECTTAQPVFTVTLFRIR